MDFLDELQACVLPGDGAIRGGLSQCPAAGEECLEALSITGQDAVARAHQEYIDAGARLIRTNSFGANAVRLTRHGLGNKVNEINWSAAQLARASAKGRGIYTAGSVGPLGLSGAEAHRAGIDRRTVFQEQVGALLDGGVELIFFEGFADILEMELALEVKQSLHHCPVICSVILPSEASDADERWQAKMLGRLRDNGADLVGMNGPVTAAEDLCRNALDEPFVAFPDAAEAGEPGDAGAIDEFAAVVLSLAFRGGRLIGGGRGTTPDHIATIVQALAAPSERP